MKPEKFEKLLREVEDFIATHDNCSMHYLPDEDIIKRFEHYKKKHVKRAIEELR